MAQFITRVELHDITDQDSYQRLHEAMEAKGFKRTILGNDKQLYKMLSAEYNFTDGTSIEEIFNLAQQAANSITPKNGVFVSLIEKCMWDGLEKAK